MVSLCVTLKVKSPVSVREYVMGQYRIVFTQHAPGLRLVASLVAGQPLR